MLGIAAQVQENVVLAYLVKRDVVYQMVCETLKSLNFKLGNFNDLISNLIFSSTF